MSTVAASDLVVGNLVKMADWPAAIAVASITELGVQAKATVDDEDRAPLTDVATVTLRIGLEGTSLVLLLGPGTPVPIED